jgi:uncharacterized membrane-anchored protein YhcB (DUF1043 family)
MSCISADAAMSGFRSSCLERNRMVSWKAYAIAMFVGVVLGVILLQPTCGLPPCPTTRINELPSIAITILIAIVILLTILDIFYQDDRQKPKQYTTEELAKLHKKKVKELREEAKFKFSKWGYTYRDI